MEKETSNQRLRKAMRRIRSREKEDSVEELEKLFALKKKQIEELNIEGKYLMRRTFMRELEKINEKLDKINRNLEKMKGYLPYN